MTGKVRRENLAEVQSLVEMIHLLYVGCIDAGLTPEQGYELSRMWFESKLKGTDDDNSTDR